MADLPGEINWRGLYANHAIHRSLVIEIMMLFNHGGVHSDRNGPWLNIESAPFSISNFLLSAFSSLYLSPGT